MIWSLAWSPRSKKDLLAVGYVVAASVGRAVLAWVETGEGWTEPGGHDRILVRARGGFALVSVSEERRTVLVLRVVPEEALPPTAPPLLGEPGAPPSSKP